MKIEVDDEDLDQLIQDSMKLQALEEAGVNNWEGYSYAMEILADMEDDG